MEYLIRHGANVDKRTNRGSIWLYALNNVRISQYLRNDLGMLDEAERIVQEMTIEECQRRVEEGIINVSVFRSYVQVFSRELARGYYVAPDSSNVQGYGRTDHGYLALLIASKI